MPLHVYRCAHCGREVLVREAGPLTDAEIARRLDEELRPAARGRAARLDGTFVLRDDIWLGVSALREDVPRAALPDRCPACRRHSTFAAPREVG